MYCALTACTSFINFSYFIKPRFSHFTGFNASLVEDRDAYLCMVCVLSNNLNTVQLNSIIINNNNMLCIT